jgi:integrase
MNRMKDNKKTTTTDYKKLTVQDFNKFKSALAEEGYEQLVDLFTIASNTGMRSSEILALKYADINYYSNSITIDLIKSRSQQMCTPIMLNDECMEVLSILQNKYPNDIFVFQSRNSRNQKNRPASPVSRQFVTKGFKSAGDSISLPITLSSLRHNYATHMSFIASSYKVDHKYLGHILGHNTQCMTENYINKEKPLNHKEAFSCPQAELSPQIESFLNAELSNNSNALSDIAKKYGISESDLSITLKTIKKLKENT